MNINKVMTVLFAIGLGIQATVAQTNPTFVKGTLEIRYNTRTQVDSGGKPNRGATDSYKLNVNVCNSALFYGTVTHLPLLTGGTFSSGQNSQLTYDMQCDVVNPANPAQTKNVGRVYGAVPIDTAGVYRFGAGTLKIGVLGLGTSTGFESKFQGNAAGKPVARQSGWFEKMKKEVISLKKTVNGKVVAINVSKYDKMSFQSLVLARGPVPFYGEATVNGDMIYDYNRYSWYFQNITVSYYENNQQKADRLTGNIRWVESPNRKSTGEGEYQFDIRINEPTPNEASVFAGPTDESAFFQTDTSISSLTGTMKYKDTMSGESVTASMVNIDLQGNKLTKQQAMYLCKLIILSSIVPINAE